MTDVQAVPPPADAITAETVAEINAIDTTVTMLVLQLANMRQLACGFLSDETIVRHVLTAAAPAIAAQAAATERERIRRFLLDGDPCVLEARFRVILDDEEAAECAGIVADLLDGGTDGQ